MPTDLPLKPMPNLRRHEIDPVDNCCRHCGVSKREILMHQTFECKPEDHVLESVVKAHKDGRVER